MMLTAHAGEEEGASCVEMCLELLKCDRIDLSFSRSDGYGPS